MQSKKFVHTYMSLSLTHSLTHSILRSFHEPETVQNGPDPAADEPRREKLQPAVDHRVAAELFPRACRNHSTETGCEGDKVEDGADEGHCGVEHDDRVGAAFRTAV